MINSSTASPGEWIWVIGNAIGVLVCLVWWGIVWWRGQRVRSRRLNGALRILYLLKNALCFVFTFAESAFTLLGVQGLFTPPPIRDPAQDQQQALVLVFVLVPVFIIGYVVLELACMRRLDHLIDRAEAVKLLSVQAIRDTEMGGAS